MGFLGELQGLNRRIAEENLYYTKREFYGKKK
jgi:hypothetical protein